MIECCGELIEKLTGKRPPESGDEVIVCIGDKEYSIASVEAEPADRSVGIMSGAVYLVCEERKDP